MPETNSTIALQPAVSVVVLNHNGGRLIEGCIESVLRQKGVEHELVLVDNASTDGSLERVAERFGDDPRLRIERNSANLGCPGGRNRGVELARFPIVAFVDDDSVLTEDWLVAISRAFGRRADMMLAATRVLRMANPLQLNSLGGTMNLQGCASDIALGEPEEYFTYGVEPLYSSGHGLIVRRCLFDEIGGFDERYINYYEDVDFCLRGQRLGHRMGLINDAVSFHDIGTEKRKSSRKLFLMMRGRIRTVLRHYELPLLLSWLWRELRVLREGQNFQRPLGSYLLSWLWNVYRLPSVIGFRLRNPSFCGVRELPAVQKAWGGLPTKYYNLHFSPDSESLSTRVEAANGFEHSALFGWYWTESSEGVVFRWSDELAGLRFRLAEPCGRLTARFCFASDNVLACRLFVMGHEGRPCFESELRARAPQYWEELRCDVELPEGIYDVLLQPVFRDPESDIDGRVLGVAISTMAFEG